MALVSAALPDRLARRNRRRRLCLPRRKHPTRHGLPLSARYRLSTGKAPSAPLPAALFAARFRTRFRHKSSRCAALAGSSNIGRRATRVAQLANRDVDRHFAQKRNAQLHRFASAPPLPKMSYRLPRSGQTKPLMFSTMPRIGMLTLRNMAMALTASSSATSCGVQTTTAPDSGKQLRERQGDVAGAGRHVDDQVIQIAPGRVAQKLRDRAVQHRSAPHHGFARRHQKAHRHHLHPADFDRLNPVVVDLPAAG